MELETVLTSSSRSISVCYAACFNVFIKEGLPHCRLKYVEMFSLLVIRAFCLSVSPLASLNKSPSSVTLLAQLCTNKSTNKHGMDGDTCPTSKFCLIPAQNSNMCLKWTHDLVLNRICSDMKRSSSFHFVVFFLYCRDQKLWTTGFLLNLHVWVVAVQK